MDKVQTIEVPTLFLIKDILIEACEKARNFVLNASKEKEYTCKDDPIDLVTKTDVEVEEFLISYIKTKLSPMLDFVFLTEETNAVELTEKPTFVIDPVDGTNNFVHNLDLLAISIGFSVNKIPILGVVHNPFTNDIFWGILEHGAYRYDILQKKNERIHVSKIKDISKALFGTHFPHNRAENNILLNLETIHELLQENVHGIRITGSAVMNLIHVFSGKIDCYFERYLKKWDIAASIPILHEAGGVYSDLEKPFDFGNYNFFICASTPELLEQLKMRVKKNWEKYPMP